MDDAALTVRHVLIRGLVQGVGYRAWTEREALRRGLAGWVRNRRDGAVEAVFAGPAETVAAMLEACRQGPRGARVESIDPDDVDEAALKIRRPGELFSVLPTA
jgi:acylphosphatase